MKTFHRKPIEAKLTGKSELNGKNESKVSLPSRTFE